MGNLRKMSGGVKRGKRSRKNNKLKSRKNNLGFLLKTVETPFGSLAKEVDLKKPIDNTLGAFRISGGRKKSKSKRRTTKKGMRRKSAKRAGLRLAYD